MEREKKVNDVSIILTLHLPLLPISPPHPSP